MDMMPSAVFFWICEEASALAYTGFYKRDIMKKDDSEVFVYLFISIEGFCEDSRRERVKLW